MQRRAGLILFFGLAYLFSWLILIPVVLLKARPELIAIATFGPSLAALITHRLAPDNSHPIRLLVDWPRALAATALGIALIILAYVVLPAIATADPHRLHWSFLLSPAVYNYSTLLGGPIGEEPGWRGYALPRLEARFGPLRGSLLLGLLWTGWHLPLFLRPGYESAPLWIYALMMTSLTVIMTLSANLGRFALLPAIALHAIFNTVSKFLNGLFGDTQPNPDLPFELVMALGGLTLAATVILLTKARLAYAPCPKIGHACPLPDTPSTALHP